MDLLNPEQWKDFINEHPQAHILQTVSWGALKASYGWSPKYIRKGKLGAMVLFRPLPLGLSIAYIPRGPIGDGDWKGFWSAIDQLCKEEKTIFLRVEPDVWEPKDTDSIQQMLPGFVETEHTVQPPRTILIDIQGSEEDILMAMKSKTRYNIRLAGRKDVLVQQSDDIETFHNMMLTTGDRDEFGIHNLDYYQRAYDLFAPENACVLLIATYKNQPLAGLMAFAWGHTAWYFYGASTNQERSRMPTYLLQWEAIQWAKSKGCKTYDLWGIPDFPEETLEDKFLDRSDGLWGVYRFKRGFGGAITRTIGTWDRIYRPGLYKLYQVWAARNVTRPGT
jgi:lipid II:glycine glycyltransferase (peptidoglycan interpeptide bridge formation enzyme)